MSKKEYFASDNFASRRTTGHNLYDPESLLTVKEEEEGYTYLNSERAFPSEDLRIQAIQGDIDIPTILRIAPRRFKGSAGLTPPDVQVHRPGQQE
jgi:hypothetical protein